jgi:hypothetical protein
MTADWTYWRRSLAGEDMPVHEGEPHIGYYRRNNRDGLPSAVAIWKEDDGTMWAQVDHNEPTCDPDRVWSIFQRSCRHPIAHFVYERRMETGEWPDVDEAAATVVRRNAETVDEETLLVENLIELEVAAARYEEIRTDEEATKVAGLRSSIGKIGSKLDKLRSERKEPHLRAGQAVDEHFRPLIARSKTADASLKAMLDAYMTAKLRAQREEEARQRRLAEEEARRAAEAERASAPAPEPVEPTPEPAPEILPQRIQTVTGRASSVGIKRIPRIVDMDKVIARYRMEPAFVDVLKRLVEADVKRGLVVDGVEIEEVADVRR